MSITIKEIAKIAGTSRGTVDRVLNGRGNVREDLQNKILKIAQENNYTPNPTAKMLSESGRPHKIGIVINSIGNEFFDEVLNGIKAIGEKYKTSNIDLIIREIKGYQVESQINGN
jgi:Transcriptional regulators